MCESGVEIHALCAVAYWHVPRLGAIFAPGSLGQFQIMALEKNIRL